MLTRRDVLRLLPASALMAASRAGEATSFERIDTHIHIHRDAPALLAAIKASSWQGLDIVVCPASGDEPFDLEEKLHATLKVHRDSGGTLAWASTFDARGFEGPGFADRTIAQPPPILRRRRDRSEDLEEHRYVDQVEIRRIPPAGRPRPAADLRGDPAGRPDARRPPRRAERGMAAAG